MTPLELSKEYLKRFGVPRTADQTREIEVIPTGLSDFDSRVLGIGGFPRGRLVELFGSPSGGKSSFAQYLVGMCQKEGGQCCWMDAEGAWESQWAGNLGVDCSKVIIPEGDFGEDYLTQLLFLMGDMDLIVVDSLAELTPKVIRDRKEDSNPKMAAAASMMTLFCHDLTGGTSDTPKLRDTRCCVVFLNQVRDNIGVLYGDTTTTPGGNALKHTASLRIRLEKRGVDKEKNRQKIWAKVVKSRVGPPLREWEGYLNWDGKFVERGDSLVEMALERKLIEVAKGNWITIMGTGDKVHGADQFREYCQEHADFMELVQGL